MKGLFFVLFSTFLVGMATGVFVYFISGLNEPIIDLPANELTSGFEITADAYGGCQMRGECPSYHINDEGKYVHLVLKREGEDARVEGTLSGGQLRILRTMLQQTDFEAVSATSFEGTCPITFDGPAYTYQIRIDEVEYRIDTCEHDTESAELFETLEEYFAELAG